MKKLFHFSIVLFILLAITGCDEAPRSAPPSAVEPTGPSNIIRVTDDDFAEKTSTGIVLVDFYADWCGPCRMMDPHIEALATKMKDQIKVVKVNTDNCPKTARKFGIQGIPALYILVDGKPVKNDVGARDEVGLRNFIADVLIEHGGKKDETNEPGESSEK